MDEKENKDKDKVQDENQKKNPEIEKENLRKQLEAEIRAKLEKQEMEKKKAEEEKRKEEESKNEPKNNSYWNSNSNDSPNGPQKPNNNNGHKTPGNFGFSGEGNKKNRIALIFFVFLIVMFATSIFSSANSGVEVSYTTFYEQLESGNMKSVVIKNSNIIEFQLIDNISVQGSTKYKTQIPYFDDNLLNKLKDNNVVVVGADADVSILTILLQLVPWILIIGFYYMIIKQTSSGGMMGNLGKSHAKEFTSNNKEKITFDDVAGQKEAKVELEEVVEFLKNPKRFLAVGARIPKGVLLVGPPGTGKTLLAKAVAGEANVAFFSTSGSDFVEMFVGMGAARVRDLFEQGRKHSPCILFIDELDAVGRSRGSGLGGGHDEREQTLNQMLVEMDGFTTDTGVIVIAATNRPDVLDSALLRPGRFDRQVVVDLPDVQEREDILKIHSKKVKLGKDVELRKIARATPGASGADLANLVNEAALYAARSGRVVVSVEDFELAHDKMILGVAKKSKVMSEIEKLATSYHESGHTLLYYYLKHLDPLHKVTIIPHGQALGVTISLPERDAYTKNRGMLVDFIKVCMGGYVAEDLHYGQTTTGTSSDIKQATNIARRMVTEWGMSDLGFVCYGQEDEPLFLGRSLAQHKDYSENTARLIDQEVAKIMNECMTETREILSSHSDQLDLLAHTLVEKETMEDNEVRELLGFEKVEAVGKFV